MTVRRANLRPTVLSAAVSVAVATVVVLALASDDAVLTALGVQGGGLLAVGVGTALVRRDYRSPGIGLALIGGCVVLVSLAVFLDAERPLSFTLRFLPGLLGLPLLVAALLPVRGQGSRTLVNLGTGGVFLSVVLSGLFLAIGDVRMLVVAAGTIVAWSVAENAIGVGQQLGRGATTWRLEAVHLVGSTLVALVGVAAITLGSDVAATGLSLASFTLLFVALLLLVAALRG